MTRPECTCRPKPGASHIDLADGCPVHDRDATPDIPRGYSPLTHTTNGGVTAYLRQLLCLRCGAVVANTRTHDLWHGGIDR